MVIDSAILSMENKMSHFAPVFPLRKIRKYHLIFWCGNFVERHSFRRVSGDSPEPLQKLCLSTKFTHQEIR